MLPTIQSKCHTLLSSKKNFFLKKLHNTAAHVINANYRLYPISWFQFVLNQNFTKEYPVVFSYIV